MTVALYFVLGLLYLFYAGYGLTGIFMRDEPHRHLFVLLNGFCLTTAVFSESYLLFHAAGPAFLLTLACALVLNIAYVAARIHSGRTLNQDGSHATPSRAERLEQWIPFLVAAGIVVLVTWSFFLSGWHSYWGSANEDMFDALNGRDAYLKGFAAEVGRFLDPLTRYQYSSLAFWSLLFQSFGGMNVFYLQGQLMLFIQVLGIYYLAKTGLQFSHASALVASFLGTCGAFYISTFFTGHEGSLIFAAIIPFLLGLGLVLLSRSGASWKHLVVAGLWMFVIFHTYVFPLGFSVIPFVFFALYRAALTNDNRRLHLKEALGRFFADSPERGRKRLRILLIAAGVLLLGTVLAEVGYHVWIVLEPVRHRATNAYRAWGISHYKEMVLIYWGLLPSSIPFGSIANPAKLDVPAIMISGYLAAAALTAAILLGLRSMLRDLRAPGVFLAFFMACWIVTFFVMKYMVVDSYYLYKFYYTNYFVGALLLVVAFKAVSGFVETSKRRFAAKTTYVFSVILAAAFIGVNLLYITLYNIDVAARPYNQPSSQLTDISPLRGYVKQGVFFNLPRFDIGNLLTYLFRYNDFPLPDAVSQFFEYELEVDGVEDVVLHQAKSRSIVWDNGTYRLYKSSPVNKLSFDTYYQGERYPDIYDNHPFRWVRDRATLNIFDPSSGDHSLVLCVEPGPGLNYKPFWLYEYVNGNLHDSIYVNGLQILNLKLPALAKRVNEMRFVAREQGRNFLPWEERFLNFRLSLIGTTETRFPLQALSILNSPHDVVPPRGCDIVTNQAESFGDSLDVLLVGSNWSTVEYENGRPLRWAYNDGQLLLANPGSASRYLNLKVELGPALGGRKSMMTFLLNGKPLDSLDLEGSQTLRLGLPVNLLKENLITLHLNRTGTSVGRDPRVLDYRLLQAYLSRE